MQIRTRKHTVTLVRSVYDPAIKRCRAVTLGTLPRDAHDIPAELRDRVTPTELAQLDRLCAANRLRSQLERRQHAAAKLPDILAEVTDWYKSQPRFRGRNNDLARLAEASRAEWTQVLSAMCAAGVGRARKRARS